MLLATQAPVRGGAPSPGRNGLTDDNDILGWNLQWNLLVQPIRASLYIASAVVLGLAYLLCRFIVTSKLGRVLMAIRDAEMRVRFLGYSATNAKLFVFTLSAICTMGRATPCAASA